jgi:hypothetical protein
MTVKQKSFGILMAVAVAAVSLVPVSAARAAGLTLPNGVKQVNSATFVQTENPCSCQVTLDGYVFEGMPFYDGTSKSAVGLWFELLAQPGYVSHPAVTSVSTTTTVSGTVEPTTVR